MKQSQYNSYDDLPLFLNADIESLVTTLLDAIPQIIETGVELLTALVENLPEIITTIWWRRCWGYRPPPAMS